MNFSTIMTQSLYGNERKILLENYDSPERFDQTVSFLSTQDFHVLNAAYWHQEIPWTVPERKISDNLIVIVKSGKLQARTADRSAVLSPGECMMVPEFVPHSYGFHSGICSAETFILHVLCEHPHNDNPFRRLTKAFFPLRHWEAKEEELLRIIALRNRSSNLAFSCAEQLVRRIFVELTESGICPVSPAAACDPRIETALKFMRQNLAVNLSVRDIAATVSLKEVRFRRLFFQACGLSPAAWLHRMRLLHARRLLAWNSNSLAETAKECGFNSVTYFCSSFRRLFHLTPEQYRRGVRT